MPATLAVALAWGAVAHAHGGLQQGIGSVRVADAVAHVHLGVDPSAFLAFDTDGDGTLEADEITAQREAIVAHASTAFTVASSDGTPANVTLADVNLPAHLHAGEAPYVRVTLQLAWDDAPDGFVVRWAHGDVAPLRLHVVRSTPDGEARATDIGLDTADAQASID